MNIGSVEHQALVEEATGANGPLVKGAVAFSNSGDLEMEAYVINPPGFESVPMPIGTNFQCALGREFRVTIAGDTRWFKKWNAGNTLIDGSAETTETFILGNANQNVQPGRRNVGSMQLGDNAAWTGVGLLADAITSSVNAYGRTLLGVPDGTLVRLTVADKSAASRWIWRAGTTMVYSSTITVRAGNSTIFEPVASYGGGSCVYPLSGDAGVDLFGMTENDHAGAALLAGAVAKPCWGEYVFQHELLPGYQLEWSQGWPIPGDEYWRAEHPAGVDATSEPMATPNLQRRVMGNVAGATEADAGYISGEGLVKYFPLETEPPTSISLRKFTAFAHPGYFFARWQGEGEYFVEENENLVPGTNALDAPDDPGNNWVINPTIYINCGYDRTITAVFHPCIHCGLPNNNGSLRGDTPLDSGTGYVMDAGDLNYGCWHHIHRAIQQVGAAWSQYTPPRAAMGITQISQMGGRLRPGGKSRSHQNGLDLDVRYVRNDGTGGPLNLNDAAQYQFYDEQATQHLVNLFLAEDTTHVFVDERGLSGLTGDRVIMLNEAQYGYGHNDHFHVRFRDPDGLPPDNCALCDTGCE